MPSPATTGRTFWFNASDNDKLWSTTTPGSGVNPGDGASVLSWDDEDAGNEFFSEGTNPPVWRSSGINGRGAVDFDGTNDVMVGNGSGATLSNVITNSAFTAFVSFVAEGFPGGGNDVCLVSDSGDFWGVYLADGGGALYAWNVDGAGDAVFQPIALNTPYVVMMKHDSGVLSCSINQGRELSTSNGNTTTLTGVVRPGKPLGANFLNGRIGEILVYNVALTGTDFSDTYTYMTDKWVPTPVGAALGALATSHARLG